MSELDNSPPLALAYFFDKHHFLSKKNIYIIFICAYLRWRVFINIYIKVGRLQGILRR
jgi:hypothetical protein